MSVVHNDTVNYLKKASVTSTLVVNKSSLQFFEYMVDGYRKIEVRLVVFLHISTVHISNLSFLFIPFPPKKHGFFRIIIGTYVIFKK